MRTIAHGGSRTWRLKERWCQTQIPLLRGACRRLWQAWMTLNGSSIECDTRFGGEPCFPHGVKGIFISGDATLGRNCIIYQQVTIGSNYLPGSKRLGAPTIGDDCLIGAGAKIIGGVRVGNNCRIGAGCVVYEDVPDNSSVVVSAPRIISRPTPRTNRYYSHRETGWHYFCDGAWLQAEQDDAWQELEAARRAQSTGGSEGGYSKMT